MISIIIPTLNEEENIAACLASTQNASNAERIVVDGGSRDRTVEIALACGARVLTSPAGRARQMNAGAEAASGDLFIFLHADTRLPEEFEGCVREILARPGIAAGAFEFRLDMSSPGLQIIERVANWRSRRLQMPYGDQAIFIRSALFREIGRFPRHADHGGFRVHPPSSEKRPYSYGAVPGHYLGPTLEDAGPMEDDSDQ